MDGYASPSIPSGVVSSELTSTTITVEYEIDENGHATGIHVTKRSGNADLDEACVDAIRNTRFKPAIQDHLKIRASGTHDFNVG